MKTETILFGTAVAVVATTLLFPKKSKITIPDSGNTNPVTTTPTTPTTTPKPTPLNVNLVLKKGVRGQEVKELQKLLGFPVAEQDGIFGQNTENKLKYVKNVIQVTLKQFPTLPTINRNALPSGTSIMAHAGIGIKTNLYDATKKADGTFYTNNNVVEKIDFGKEIGEVRGVSSTGNWYLILRKGFFSDTYYFVKASEVKKI